MIEASSGNNVESEGRLELPIFSLSFTNHSFIAALIVEYMETAAKTQGVGHLRFH